jgi:hypothetical protein
MHELPYATAMECYTEVTGAMATARPGTNMTVGVDNAYSFTDDGRIPQSAIDSNMNVIGANEYNIADSGGAPLQSGPLSQFLNLIPGMNATALFHDAMWGATPLTAIPGYMNWGTMLPAAGIAYYTLRAGTGFRP